MEVSLFLTCLCPCLAVHGVEFGGDVPRHDGAHDRGQVRLLHEQVLEGCSLPEQVPTRRRRDDRDLRRVETLAALPGCV